jgi:hypothetical protein
MRLKRFKFVVDTVTRKTVVSAQTPKALQKRARIMAFKNQEIDLEVNPHVNGRGADQEVSVIRRTAAWGCIEAGIGFYGEPLCSKNRMRTEARDEALRRCYGIDNDRSFCRWLVSKEKAEQRIVEVRLNPFLSALGHTVESATMQDTTPMVWVRRQPGVRIVPLHLGNSQLRTLQILEHEGPRGSREEEKLFGPSRASHFMDKQQCVEHCHHLGCLEDVELVEGKLFKEIEETTYDTVWSVAMLAYTDVVLLHDIVKADIEQLYPEEI